MATFIARGRGGGTVPRFARKTLIVACAVLVLMLISVYLEWSEPVDDPLMARLRTIGTVVRLFLPVGLFAQWWRARRAEEQLADTELRLSPYGVAYACAAGHFEVPWSSVRWMGFESWPGLAPTEVLRVDSAAWTGPVRRLCYWWSGRRALRLDLGRVDRGTVAQAVHAATGGQVRL